MKYGRQGAMLDVAVNALTEKDVAGHFSMMQEKFDRIDISLNLISVNDVQGKPLADISLSDFMAPIQSAMQTQFITAVAAAKMMSVQGG